MRQRESDEVVDPQYDVLLAGIAAALDQARRAAVRSINAVMTATYWEVGRRIVVFEQDGAGRAIYGTELLKRLSVQLTSRFGRGFGVVNLAQMRKFHVLWPLDRIFQTPSEQSSTEATLEKEAVPASVMSQFPLPWSHYVRLMAVKDAPARAFYETEALRGGWSVRQLDRQIASQFYERTALSRNKAAMLAQGAAAIPGDILTPEEELRDPFVLEFLDLKDEYSEAELEEALIRHLEVFLLELGNDFTFVGRQRRLRIGDAWYRIDLIFFHRRLRCLVVVDLKSGALTAADAGHMHVYLNYVREHWSYPNENPPVGLILCSERNEALAHYAFEGVTNTILAAEYRLTLPDPCVIANEVARTRKELEIRRLSAGDASQSQTSR
jgi:predicted nuclease of restriction endonuclease-like (RecB) superfamily